MLDILEFSLDKLNCQFVCFFSRSSKSTKDQYEIMRFNYSLQAHVVIKILTYAFLVGKLLFLMYDSNTPGSM